MSAPSAVDRVPAVGAPAPDFALRDQHGATVSLAELRGLGPVLVVFYPFSFSRVCTGEMAALRDRFDEFVRRRAAVAAISCDSRYVQRAFADEEGLDFAVLADAWPHGAVARRYGVFDAERGCALRGSFVVAPDGRVAWSVVNAIPDARVVDDYLTAIDALSAGR